MQNEIIDDVEELNSFELEKLNKNNKTHEECFFKVLEPAKNDQNDEGYIFDINDKNDSYSENNNDNNSKNSHKQKKKKVFSRTETNENQFIPKSTSILDINLIKIQMSNDLETNNVIFY